MKKTLLSLAILTVALAVPPAVADEPDTGKTQRLDQGDAPNLAEGQKRRRGPDAQRWRGDRDPRQMVARLMQQFDQDGDEKLDAKELTEMLQALRSRLGRAGRPGGSDSAAKRSPAEGTPGGARPKRPESE